MNLKQLMENQALYDPKHYEQRSNPDDFLTTTKKINAYSSIIIIMFGLIGHFITISVYSHKKNRATSSDVYLYCLAISDALFLIVHFFEDTIRTFLNVYGATTLMANINITDKYNLSCRLINYIRYVLRFVSAYIIIAFTIQRLFIIYLSPRSKFKSKEFAWFIILVICFIGLFISFWVPFLFEIQEADSINKKEHLFYCDIRKKFKNEYFLITLVYSVLIMFIPIVTIFVCNSIIIYKARQANSKELAHAKSNLNVANNKFDRQNLKLEEEEEEININDPNNRKNLFKTRLSNESVITCRYYIEDKSRNVNKMAKILLWISFSFAILNLPYFITWCLFFYEVAFHGANTERKNYLFSSVQISEIFLILHYSIQFYINSFTSIRFRQKLLFDFRNSVTN